MTLYGKPPPGQRKPYKPYDNGKFTHKKEYGERRPEQDSGPRQPFVPRDREGQARPWQQPRGPPTQFQQRPQYGPPQERRQGGYERRDGFGQQREFGERRGRFPPKIIPHQFPGVFTNGRELFTKNLVPGIKVYGEQLLKSGEVEYRKWSPSRSKLGALIASGAKSLPLKADSKVLYLGAASGTTVSHVSDIAIDGVIYAVEFAPRVFRELIEMSRLRKNIIPILADANHPELYSSIAGKVDFVFQDVAQPNQTEIFIKNCKALLNHGGFGILALKARSVDVTIAPQEIFRRSSSELVKGGLEVIETIDIGKFEIDHACFLAKMR
ncbi:MAG: fibrillarin-like rRNA/tRNA 2'-O-methyltransferase [Candidatus Thermoplasmatota archaeon]|nr:fibrillarin-like rRNA/tRNA 2'-O-methyltransferase [Candidatus Thermoplasmatota archaeon]